MNARFEPAVPPARPGHARRPTSRSLTARRSSARWPPSPSGSPTTSTPPTRTPRWPRCRGWARSSSSAPTRCSIRGCGLRNAQPPAEPIDVGNAGTLMRLLPGLAGLPAGRELHARRRRLDPPASGRPDRRAAASRWARGSRPGRAASRPSPITGARAAPGSTTSCRWPARRSSRACCWPGWRRAGTTSSSRWPPATTPSGCCSRAGGARHPRSRPRGGLPGPRSAAPTSSSSSTIEVPGDMSSAAFLIAAGVLVPRLAPGARGRRGQLDPDGVCAHPAAHGGDRGRRARARGHVQQPTSRSATSTSRTGRSRRPRSRPTRFRWRSTSCPLVALLGCFAEGETVVRGAAELRVKESDRITTVVEGLRGLGADIEALARRLRRARHRAACAAGAIDAHGDHRLALLGAVAGLASQEGVEVVGMEAADVSYPGFADDIASLSA